jgi:multidrug efflux pump subunit AcrB
MAWAMIAGLLVSTLLTLYVIPVLFEWLCARDPGTARE